MLKISEHVIDHDLEDGRSICESKGHDQILILSAEGIKPSLPLVPLPDRTR